MTTVQPGAPAPPQPSAAPGAPAARAGAPENLADQIDRVNRAVEEAARRSDARAASASAAGQEAGARVDEALSRAREAVAAQAPAGARTGNVAVIKNAQGYVIVTGPDGRTVTYDPKVGLDEDAVQQMIQTALEPPRVPERRSDTRDAVPVVAIVFTFLFLISLVISRTVRGRPRVPAAAGSPEVGARLARIEQALEAVAIEVERISESERYSARLLTERLPAQSAANGQGAALPAAAPTLDVQR